MDLFRDAAPYGGGSGLPCGASRKFLMQISLKNNEMEIIVDFEKPETVALFI